MRLDKFVCKSTELSLPEATEKIQAGAVCINSVVTREARTQVHKNNTVTLSGRQLSPRDFRYLLLHKPSGTVCSNIDEHYPSVFNHLEIERAHELHCVGRLDVDTTGLLLLTDDGHWSYNITVPSKHCNKTYRVNTSRRIAFDTVEKFAQGIELQGEALPTRPAQLEIIEEKQALLTITEGRFHQVKRMFSAVGNRVASLHRERIGDIYLDVDVGEWRHLRTEEVQTFLP